MPVLASDGHCYEMEGMLHLFRHGWARSPLTREALEPWVVYARFVHDVQRWKRAAGGTDGTPSPGGIPPRTLRPSTEDRRRREDGRRRGELGRVGRVTVATGDCTRRGAGRGRACSGGA